MKDIEFPCRLFCWKMSVDDDGTKLTYYDYLFYRFELLVLESPVPVANAMLYLRVKNRFIEGEYKTIGWAESQQDIEQMLNKYFAELYQATYN